MSMFRKTVLATAIIGAGLGSMTGAAFAGDDPGDGGHSSQSTDDSHGHSHGKHHESWGHDRSSSCSNDVTQASETKGGALADIAGGAQTAAPINVCHILDDNSVLNDLSIDVG